MKKERSMVERIMSEIEDLRMHELFNAYNAGSHVFDRHCNMSDRDLRRKLSTSPHHPDELNIATRFNAELSENEVCGMICDALLSDIKEVTKWVQNNCRGGEMVVCYDLTSPIGDGFVWHTSWEHTYAMSRIIVVLTEPRVRGRSFSVLTAYPSPDPDEVDFIWEEVTDFEESL